MPIADEIAALNLDPALREQIMAALSQGEDVDKLRAQAQYDALKIQALTLELAHYKRIRFGVRNEALSPEQRDLFKKRPVPTALPLRLRLTRSYLNSEHGALVPVVSRCQNICPVSNIATIPRHVIAPSAAVNGSK
ncbi:hypothetical protein KVH01_14755 [Pseudomonas sp. SWRI124]|nr:MULTISPECIES: hypothetical protein [Pseudomonas]MBV4481174.1 hypothetical protein [Pseudomonas khavaziana]